MVTTQVTAKSDPDSFLDDVSVPFWEEGAQNQESSQNELSNWPAIPINYANMPSRHQELKKSDPRTADILKATYESASGNYDLYVVFVERGLQLLNQRGQFAFILPHKFFNAKYGEALQEIISRGKHLRHVVHFGHQQIFDGATNYVCLLFLAKCGANKCRFVRADNLQQWLTTFRGTEA
jgi:Eco57I restriction-modification methylase